MNALQKFFQGMSQSERRLAFVVAGLLFVALVFVIILRCMDTLETMDATIESQQEALLKFTQQAALVEPVERAFSAMAAQHSSHWTQEEIHDRLRVEITRLSLRQVPPENAPLPAAANRGETLVEIRSMPVGALEDSGEGYRSYQISFRTEPTSIQNIATFLQRLQQSTQALRVDSLELTRQPTSTEVSATFRVTRTVIGDAATPQADVPKPVAATKSQKNLIHNPGFDQWDAQKTAPQDWVAENMSFSADAKNSIDGSQALSVAVSGGESGSLYQVQHLLAGKSYELQMDAFASGESRLQATPEGGASLEGAVMLEVGASPHHYRCIFTVPGPVGTPVTMRVPELVVSKAGSNLIVDNVVLREVNAP